MEMVSEIERCSELVPKGGRRSHELGSSRGIDFWRDKHRTAATRKRNKSAGGCDPPALSGSIKLALVTANKL